MTKGSPDRYAAAICIAIRSDCYADILKAEAATRPCCEGAAGLLQTLSGFRDVFVERFTSFSSWLSSLPSLPSSLSWPCYPPWSLSWLNASQHLTCMHSDYTIIAKLILRASKKVNDGRAVEPVTGRSPRVMRGHSAPCRIKTGRSSHVVGRRSRRKEAERTPGSFARMLESKVCGECF